MVKAKLVIMLNQVGTAKKPATAAQSGLRWLWLGVIFLIIDQVTKLWVAANFELFETVAVIPMFSFTYVHNEGAAFSFLGSAGGWQRWFFTAIAVVISSLLLYWMRALDKSEKLLAIAYSLVLSGAIGNLIDRVSYGYVIDFIHLYYESYQWPVFNVADISICVGAGLIIFEAITAKDKSADDKLAK